MKRLLALVTASILAVCLLAGCGGVRTYVDPEKTISVSVDQEFVIALDSNPTTGYDWEESYDESMLRLDETESKYVPDEKAAGLVGAGGTHCPVYHTFFNQNYPRKGEKIVALETEIPEDWQDGRCQLWFLENGLPGYSWYVPKAGGYINIGVGGNESVLKQRGSNIHEHWAILINKLHELHLVSEREFEPDGYVYYLQGDEGVVQLNKALIIGDSAGLATLDMGEGIGPAIRSGLMAADAILTGAQSYSIDQIQRYSLLPWYLRWIDKL